MRHALGLTGLSVATAASTLWMAASLAGAQSFNSSGPAANGPWVNFDDVEDVRHEGGFVQAGGKFYVLGGRESNTVRVYDPVSGDWSTGASSPIKLHHFQAVEIDGLIYVIGAMTGECCADPEAPNVYLYDPVADVWTTGPAMPAGRPHGGGGAAAVNGRIYLVSGNDNGHYGNAVPHVDAFDPATGTFTPLADMPHPRDHFFIAHRNGKLYAAGGRISNAASDGDVFDDSVVEVDVYDIASNTWTTLPASANLPTPRAGAAVGIIGAELVVAGGESGVSSAAHPETEVLDLTTQTWRRRDDMLTPRHSAQAIVSNEGFYLAAGSDQRGGPTGALLDIEALYHDGITAPAGGSISPALLQGPASVDFGTLSPGSSSERTITVTNVDGDQALVIEGHALTGNSSFTVVSAPSAPRVLAPGTSAGFDVRFTAPDVGSKSASLRVLRAGGDDAVVALSGAASQAAPQAALGISIIEDTDPVAEGASLMYTVTVSNSGPSSASNVRIDATLSPLLGDPTTVGCLGDPAGVPICLLGEIAPGASRTLLISVDVRPDAGGNVAQSVVSVGSDVDDPDTGDNSATATTGIVQGAPSDVADLAIAKTAAASFGSIGGGTVAYTIMVSNGGPAPVIAASVVDLVPVELSNVSWQCIAASGGYCVASGTGSIDELVDLDPGSSVTFTLQGDFTREGADSIVNTALVNVPHGMTDSDPGNNESTATIRRVIFVDGFERRQVENGAVR